MALKGDPGSAVLLGEFKEYLKIKNYSQKSIDNYRLCTIKFILWMEETLKKRVNEITKKHIDEYNTYLKDKGYRPNTIHRHMYTVKRLFSWLEEAMYILINPAEDIVIPKPRPEPPLILSQAEVRRILEQPNTATLLGIRDRAILEVFYSTGIRIGELINLTIYDIELKEGYLRISKGKFSKDRFAPLTKPAVFWLKDYITNVRPKFTQYNPRERTLFVGGRLGRKLLLVQVGKIIRENVLLAGIRKHITAHTFRHCFATHMLENKADIFRLQRLLGHEHLKSTQRYTRVKPHQIKQEHDKYHPRQEDESEKRKNTSRRKQRNKRGKRNKKRRKPRSI